MANISRSKQRLMEHGEVTTGSITSLERNEAWTLSQTGNWLGHTRDNDGDTTDDEDYAGTFSDDVNEWTARANSVGSYTENMTYDDNGNMTSWGFRDGDGQKYTYSYDAFGRLMKVAANLNMLSPHDITAYRYNGLGHRIMWQYDDDGDQTLESQETFHFMYDERWRIVGTFRNADTDAKESFVYHCAGNAGFGDASYIDNVILRDKDTTNGWTGNPNGSLDERRYYCQNWRADVVALTKSDGQPVEFIRYSSYGRAQAFGRQAAGHQLPVTAPVGPCREGCFVGFHRPRRTPDPTPAPLRLAPLISTCVPR